MQMMPPAGLGNSPVLLRPSQPSYSVEASTSLTTNGASNSNGETKGVANPDPLLAVNSLGIPKQDSLETLTLGLPDQLLPASTSLHFPTGRPPALLFVSSDKERLSQYQILVRQQIEVFEALQEDVETTAQGRVRRIILGQVGIRCRHCTILPPGGRRRGAFYYPTRLDGVYQAAQNMTKSHLADQCRHVTADVRREIAKGVDKNTKSSTGGGKNYWAQTLSSLGVFECDQLGVLKFNSTKTTAKESH
jgi:hypothetical protein